MIRLLYDDEIFSTQLVGGISRYFSEIISRLAEKEGVSISIPLTVTINEYIRQQPSFHGLSFPGRSRFKGRRLLLRLANRPALVFRLRRQDFDVFHFTYYDAGLLPYLADKPFVITIHDLIPEALERQTDLISKKRRLIERATRIIAVSQHTKEDLLQRYSVDPEKIDVIYHGVSESLVYRGGAPPGDVPQPFLLFVGRREGYKNFNAAAAPIARVLHAVPELHLLCAGGDPMTREETTFFRKQGCSDRVLWRDFTDAGLAWSYAHATALVYPSLNEGFGMPILEAFANDCPTIVSNRSCLPEIAGAGALYFDPGEPLQLEAVLRRIIADPKLRRSLTDAARQRMQQFSWRRSTEAHLRCYANAMKQ